eukprot:maker-scaffold56_size446035-snap-gene-3.26 protein:Tk11500 transcript:maker-scaffold56_size446035-snap-gene-3.26-mRNA-1 annotation:"protein fam57a isoform x2"
MWVEIGTIVHDKPSWGVGIVELGSGIIWYCLWHVVIHQWIQRSRRPVKASQARDIATKSVSILFSITTCLVGASIFWGCRRDLIRETHYALHHYGLFAAPYFAYDIVAMFLVYREEALEVGLEPQWIDFIARRFLMVFHHAVLALLGVPILVCLRRDLGDCLLALGFLMEASTPFVSLRALLAGNGYKSSKWYLVNGILMLVSFFTCRIVLIPYIYVLYARQLGVSLVTTVVEHVPHYCTLCMGIVYLPQLYWFGLMLRGSCQALGRDRTKRQ